MKTAWATVALLAMAGCAAPPLHEQARSLEPGAFAEVNLVLAANDTVEWSWSVTEGSRTFFNVHSHPRGPSGPMVEHVTRLDKASDEGVFTAATAGSYSLYWENYGTTPVDLTYRVWGEGKLDPDHPPV